MKKSQRNKIIFGLLSSFFLSFLFLIMMQRGMFSTLNLKISNFFYYQSENEASKDIVIVAIDNKAFEIANSSELGTLTFTKESYAKVIENLEKAGVKAIGIDIILSEKTNKKDQKILASVLKKYDNIILAAEPKTKLSSGLKPLSRFFNEKNKNLGAILFSPDKDNVLRRQKLFFSDEDVPFSFALQILKKYLGLLDEDAKWKNESYLLMPFSVRVADKKFNPISIPKTEGGLLINFFGAPESYQTISFADLYKNKFIDRKTGNLVDLKNKIVLIGEMGTALHDEQYVPLSFGKAMSGVEIHANLIQTILFQKYLLNQSDFSRNISLILIILLSIFSFLSLSVSLSVFLFIFGIIIYTIITWIVFEYGIILNTFYPYLAFFISLVLAYIYRYFTEARALSKTEYAFGRYVNEDVVKKILENPESLKLGGEQKLLTVFFSDIANFTTLSEKLNPTELVSHLNDYLDRMSQIILKHNGTLDKFVGDAIIAFWGAPIEEKKHAEKACLSAIEYMEELKKFQKECEKKNKPILEARIGIHSGEMIVGNIGSTKRFDYTVIGDAVNLGARLEGVNKHYGTRILISEATYALAKSKIEVREIDLITVKGKTKAVRIYELLAKKGGLGEKEDKIIQYFSKGLRFYRSKNWEEAINSFEKVLEIKKDDMPSQVYLKRCKKFKTSKLPDDWDATHEMKEK